MYRARRLRASLADRLRQRHWPAARCFDPHQDGRAVGVQNVAIARVDDALAEGQRGRAEALDDELHDDFAGPAELAPVIDARCSQYGRGRFVTPCAFEARHPVNARFLEVA